MAPLIIEGSLPEIAQYSPYYLPLNVFIASKGSNLYIFSASFVVLQNQLTKGGISRTKVLLHILLLHIYKNWV